jgi:FG-GAP repeat
MLPAFGNLVHPDWRFETMRRFSAIAALMTVVLLGSVAARGAPLHGRSALRSASRVNVLTVTAAPDFNGDGFADLAVGVPHDATESATDAGAVNVLYGTTNGLQVLTPLDQRWNQGSSQMKGAAETGDLFGAALATGDFNGDGFTDLAIGAPGDSASDQDNAGVVNVLYGSVDGLQSVAPDDQLWTQDATEVDDIAEPDDNFGSALGAGDFNNDGFADLAVGVPGESVGTIGQAGAVNVLYGSTDGLQVLAPADQFWNQDTTGVRDIAQAGDEFGTSLAAADFDKNGVADLAIGIPYQNVGSLSDSGAVAVLYGTTSAGLQPDSPDDDYWNQNSPGVRDIAQAGDTFGASLASGDFDDNGYNDLAIGIPGQNVGSLSDGGAVSVLYGKAGGLQADSPDDDYWNQNSSGVQDTSEANDRFGTSLGSGDFDGNGFDDLAIGVPDENVGTIVGAGATAVLYGLSGGLQAASPDDNFWNQDSLSVKGDSETGDLFGTALAGGDYDANGFDDLSIGIPGELAGGFTGAGAVAVLYSTSNGLQADSPDDDRWSQSSPGLEGDSETGDSFGSALAG